MRLTVRALIESIGCDGLTLKMIREAILDSDQLSIDPKVSPYKEMIAQETRWWAYPEARSTKMEKAAVENKQAAAIITKMGEAAVEAKQAAEKKKESRAAAAEEAEVQESSNGDESEDLTFKETFKAMPEDEEQDEEVSLNVRPKKGAPQQKQVTFEDKTECNYAGCK